MQRYPTPEAAIAALPGLARNAGRTRPAVPPSLAMAEDEIAPSSKIGGRLLVLGDAHIRRCWRRSPMRRR